MNSLDWLRGDFTLLRLDSWGTAVAWSLSILLLLAFLAAHRRGGWSGWTGFLLRAMALLLLAILVLDPVTESSKPEPGSFLAAVDLSASISPDARKQVFEKLGDVLNQPMAAPVLLGFGSEARVLANDHADWKLLAGRDESSDPGDALAMLLLHRDAAQADVPLWLFSDGNLPQRVLPRPRGRLPRTRMVPLKTAPVKEVRVTHFKREEGAAVDQGAPFVATGFSTVEGPAECVVWVDGVMRRRIPLSLKAGETFEAHGVLPSSLSPGAHRLGVRVVPTDGEAAVRGVVDLIRVPHDTGVRLVTDHPGSPLVTALTTQEQPLQVVSQETFLSEPIVDANEVLILDRVPVPDLLDETVMAALARHVDRGGGMLFLPREDRAELVSPGMKPFSKLLPLLGLPPPPDPIEEEPKEEPPPLNTENEEPGEVDPNNKSKEEVLAPTLGLLLLVDSSSSMREENRLLLAIEASIAAAEVLHPEDYIGVIQFNTSANPVLELTKAGDRTRIKDRVSRIEARGGTSFGPPLELAKEILDPAPLGVKHVVLLSDGDSRPYLLKPLLTSMSDAGITVSTVGCGSQCNRDLLSDIAYWGKGKFLPAMDSKHVPRLFTVEAQRIIEETGARSRKDAEAAAEQEPQEPDLPTPLPPEEPTPEEPPRATPIHVARPTTYLADVPVLDTPGVMGFHPAVPVEGAWVSVETESREPIAAHAFVGNGRVAMWTLPLDGAWAQHLVALDEYPRLLSQTVRFLLPHPQPPRFQLDAQVSGRTLTVNVADRLQRELPRSLEMDVLDPEGAPAPMSFRRIGERSFESTVPASVTARMLHIRVRASKADGGGMGQAICEVPEIPELSHRSPHLEGLERWARSLEGELTPRVPDKWEIPLREVTTRQPRGRYLAMLLLGILVLDFLVWRYGR